MLVRVKAWSPGDPAEPTHGARATAKPGGVAKVGRSVATAPGSRSWDDLGGLQKLEGVLIQTL